MGLLVLGLAVQRVEAPPSLERYHQLTRKLLVLDEQTQAQHARLCEAMLAQAPTEAEALLRSSRNTALGGVSAALAVAEAEARDLYRSDNFDDRERLRSILENLARLPTNEQLFAQRIQAVLDGVADGSLQDKELAAKRAEVMSQSFDIVNSVQQAQRLAETSFGVAVLLSDTAADSSARKLERLLGLAGVLLAVSALMLSLDRRQQQKAEANFKKQLETSAQALAERDQQGLAMQRAAQADRRAALDLALARLEQRSLTESIGSALIFLDERSLITLANSVARRLFQLDERSINKPFLTQPLVTPLIDALGGSEAFAQRLLLNKERLEAKEVALETGFVSVAVTPYFDEAGKMRGAIMVAEDITERVESRKRLMLSERLAVMGRMSAQVAHEIRNPLSAIALNADLLQDELSNDDHQEARHLLGAIAREVDRLTAVTDEYLRLARLRAPALQREDLAALTSELCTFLGEEMRRRHITATLDIQAAPAHVWIDSGQARQALLNVLKNAIEAMPNGGTITIRLSESAPNYELSVTDEGPGIAPNSLARIFDPFFTTKEGGTGLGLPITQQIIADHGGEVRVDSALGVGTTMRVQLPMASATQPGALQHSDDELVT